MGKHEKKKQRKVEDAPVPTGHDHRAQKRQMRDGAESQATEAPDGVTGNWS